MNQLFIRLYKMLISFYSKNLIKLSDKQYFLLRTNRIQIPFSSLKAEIPIENRYNLILNNKLIIFTQTVWGSYFFWFYESD